MKFRIPLKGARVAARVYNPSDAKRSGIEAGWSLARLRHGESDDSLIGGLRSICRKMEIEHAFAPDVSKASARVITQKEMAGRQIELGSNVFLSFGEESADGVFLEKGEAFMMSGRGCPVIIASDSKNVAIVHAGRDSLIYRDAVMDNVGKASRPYMSVVDSLIDAFVERESFPGEMVMAFSIPTAVFEHPLEHPTYGNFNRALHAFVEKQWPGNTNICKGSMYLNLEDIFLSQAHRVGVKASVVHPAGTIPGMTYPRNSQETRNGARNLIIVQRVY